MIDFYIHSMPEELTKIWNYDKSTGRYYIPGLRDFLIMQEKRFPSMQDLYKHQMELVKKDHPNVYPNIISSYNESLL